MPPTAERGAALITGAGRRIGRVLALRAAAAGFDVAIHHHHSQADAAGVAADAVMGEVAGRTTATSGAGGATRNT